MKQVKLSKDIKVEPQNEYVEMYVEECFCCVCADFSKCIVSDNSLGDNPVASICMNCVTLLLT